MKNLVIFILILGVVLLVRISTYFSSQQDLPIGVPVKISSELRSDPKVAVTQKFSIVTSSGQRIFVTTQPFPAYHYGQRLLLTGSISEFEVEQGKMLNYMNYPRVEVVQEYANPIYFLSYNFRSKVQEVFQAYLPYPSSALLLGIVFGVRESMPNDLTENLVKTGVIHITAASGMNVTLLAGAVCAILASVLSRKTALVVAIVAIWFYASVAGFESSIVRASLMASIAFGAGLLGRQNTGWYALLLTGFFMVFRSPAVIYDVGFQLSFFSTAGILFIMPILIGRKKIDGVEDAGWFLSEDLRTTVAAQLATVPILLFTFGQYSVFSILVNMLVLWTIPPLMVLGALAGGLGLVWQLLAAPFLYLSLPFLWYLESVVNFSAEIIPVFSFEDPPLFLGFLYYLVLISWIIYSRRPR